MGTTILRSLLELDRLPEWQCHRITIEMYSIHFIVTKPFGIIVGWPDWNVRVTVKRVLLDLLEIVMPTLAAVFAASGSPAPRVWPTRTDVALPIPMAICGRNPLEASTSAHSSRQHTHTRARKHARIRTRFSHTLTPTHAHSHTHTH